MLDALDQKILGQLLVSSDLTSAELGEKVGLSPSAAHRRVGKWRVRLHGPQGGAQEQRHHHVGQ